MPIFKSKHPHMNVPEDLTVWQWLFESSKSPIGRVPESELAGFFDFPTKTRINWREVKDAATHVSTALVKKYGFQPGDTVSLFSRNTIWYPVMLHGTTRIGGIVSGASPAYGVEEMTYALKTASARFLATSPTPMDVAKEAAAAAGIPDKHIFILEGELDGYTSIQSLIAMGKSYGADGQVPAFDVRRDAGGKGNKEVCGFLSFSSGTTGLPKAVMISHHNMIAQCMQMELAYEPTLRRVLAVLPAFHITGLVHHLHVPMLLNAEVVMLPGFSMAGMLDAVVAHRITELLLVPPILIRLVRDPLVASYDLGHVRSFWSGAAPPSPEVLQQLRRMFPAAGFKQGWGMTESTSCITMHTPDIGTWDYSHTVGTVVANTEVRIVREDGSEAGVGEPGEILARGPQVVMGYLDRPDATAETFDADGWLHTGDQGVMDDRGCIIITDRIKELIKVKGIGVAPAELEDVLLGHRDVEDVAVLAIPDEYSGELPKAYVVPKPGVKASEELGRAIISYIQDKKVRHKWLAEIEFIDAIPKSPSGKILRRELRDKEKSGKKGLFVRAEAEPRAKL